MTNERKKPDEKQTYDLPLQIKIEASDLKEALTIAENFFGDMPDMEVQRGFDLGIESLTVPGFGLPDTEYEFTSLFDDEPKARSARVEVNEAIADFVKDQIATAKIMHEDDPMQEVTRDNVDAARDPKRVTDQEV